MIYSSQPRSSQSRARAILDFWFGKPTDPDYGQYRKAWFIKDAAFDEQIRLQFLTDVQSAAEGAYDDWKLQLPSAVALVLLLDQFPRNLYRGQPRSFATDSQAQVLAQDLVEEGCDRHLIPCAPILFVPPFRAQRRYAASRPLCLSDRSADQ